MCIEFDEQQPVAAFERYLKTGSGREFCENATFVNLFGRTVERPSPVPGPSFAALDIEAAVP